MFIYKIILFMCLSTKQLKQAVERVAFKMCSIYNIEYKVDVIDSNCVRLKVETKTFYFCRNHKIACNVDEVCYIVRKWSNTRDSFIVKFNKIFGA